MDEAQQVAYDRMSTALSQELRAGLRKGDNSLLGVVLNALLAWPDCAFRDELIKHPRTKAQLWFQTAIFRSAELSPKERALIDLCKQQKALGRKALVYTVYSGVRDTTSRLKLMLEAEGLKTAVLRASVDAAKREDWVAEQVDRGVDVLVTNPELKLGLAARDSKNDHRALF